MQYNTEEHRTVVLFGTGQGQRRALYDINPGVRSDINPEVGRCTLIQGVIGHYSCNAKRLAADFERRLEALLHKGPNT